MKNETKIYFLTGLAFVIYSTTLCLTIGYLSNNTLSDFYCNSIFYLLFGLFACIMVIILMICKYLFKSEF